MTELPTQAFEHASRLPDNLQDQLARELLDELQGESRWDQALADSQDKLEQLAEKAERNYRAGKTKSVGARCHALARVGM